MTRRVNKADLFEFTTFKQLKENEFVFNYLVQFTNGEIIKFQEKLILPFAVKNLDRNSKVLLRQIHTVLGINYYKLYAPKKVRTPYNLDSRMSAFWNHVYRYGLGEFAYKNGLRPQALGNFRANKPAKDFVPKPRIFDEEAKYLTGIGGGKDSIVAWDLLRKMEIRQRAFALESPSHNNELRREVILKLDSKALLAVRIPDLKLEKLRQSGKVYRGHSPMSVIVAFVALFCAYQRKYGGFLVANESSSNEYNLTWGGIKINHQWTKTASFENSLNELLQYLDLPLIYLSVVRPMNELMITSLFARMPEYHNVFFSCNRSILDKQGRPKKWCGECAKCASAALLLAPFLTPKQISGIIGKNMLADTSNTKLFAELAGFTGDKPFECVCTKEEARSILRFMHNSPHYKDFPVVREMAKLYDDEEPVLGIEELLRYKPSKAFPLALSKKLRRAVKSYENV